MKWQVVRIKYGFYAPEIVSEHQTESGANKMCERLIHRHEALLHAGGFESDNTVFKVVEAARKRKPKKKKAKAAE